MSLLEEFRVAFPDVDTSIWNKIFNGVRWDRLNVGELTSVGDLAPPAFKRSVDLADLVLRTKEVDEIDSEVVAETDFAFETFLSLLLDQELPDEDFVFFYKPRSRADLPLRRARFADVLDWVRRLGYMDQFLNSLRVLRHCDYIMALNLCIARVLFGTVWWHFWDTLVRGLWTFERFVFVAKKVSDILKTNNSEYDLRFFAECANLVGYRNPPIPGFDVIDETKKLAEGGDEHREDLVPFKTVALEILNTDASYRPVFVSFEQYVEGLTWATSGSSSEGKFAVSHAGEKVQFRSRKNLLAAVGNIEDLAARARTNDKQINKSIVKCELGKLRIAVSSDVLTYLQMHYITYLMGDFYKKWPGSTAAESANEQYSRNASILKRLVRNYGMPVDFKGFDHQPTLAELMTIASVFVDHALLHTPAEFFEEVKAIGDRVIAGFTNAVLIEPSSRTVFTITGGLMSGLFWTSRIGDAWNAVTTERARRLLARLSIRPREQYTNIKGDDTNIITDSWEFAYLLLGAYRILGAKLGDGKFSILWEQTEFLRVWYSLEGLTGYAARALPGMTQRKPWAATPWDEVGTLRSSVESALTAVRRGVNKSLVDVWAQVLADGWSRRSGLDAYLLQVPRTFGGLGVFPWDGIKVPVKHLPQAKAQFRPPEANPQFVAKLHGAVTDLGVSVSAQTIQQLSRERISTMLTSDDIPAINRWMRDDWNRQIAHYSTSWRFIASDGWPQPLSNALFSLAPVEGGLDSAERQLRARAVGFGLYAKFENDWKLLQDVSRYEEISPVNIMELKVPGFKWDLRRYERRGWSRGNALDWMFGSISSLILEELHPHLTTIASLLCAIFVSTASVLSSAAVPSLVAHAWPSVYHLLRRNSTVKLLLSW